MGKIIVSLPDYLEKKLRELAGRKFGLKRGSVKKAVEEAVLKWVMDEERASRAKPSINPAKCYVCGGEIFVPITEGGVQVGWQCLKCGKEYR